MNDHASATRREFFRAAGGVVVAGAVFAAGRPGRLSADEPMPDSGFVVDQTASAGEPAERGRLIGEVPFPFAGFAAGDLVCLNNFGTCRRNHQGVDIGELRQLTEPVTLIACADGIVTQRDTSSRPGNFVVIQGDDGRWYRYHHLDEFDEAIEVGGRVTLGQPLGTMGATGNTSWPHLHFEIWVGDGAYSPAGEVLDPVPLLTIPGEVQLDARVCD